MVDDVDGESLFYKVEQWWMDQNLSHINSCKHVCPLSLTTEPSCSFQRSEILGKMAQQGRVIFLVTTLELQCSNSCFIGLVSYEIYRSKQLSSTKGWGELWSFFVVNCVPILNINHYIAYFFTMYNLLAHLNKIKSRVERYLCPQGHGLPSTMSFHG